MESLSLSPSHITLSLTARYQGKFISKRSDFISLNWCKINEKILLRRPRCVSCPATFFFVPPDVPGADSRWGCDRPVTKTRVRQGLDDSAGLSGAHHEGGHHCRPPHWPRSRWAPPSQGSPSSSEWSRGSPGCRATSGPPASGTWQMAAVMTTISHQETRGSTFCSKYQYYPLVTRDPGQSTSSPPAAHNWNTNSQEIIFILFCLPSSEFRLVHHKLKLTILLQHLNINQVGSHFSKELITFTD